MPLQKCTDCKKKVSSQAGSCPNCGAPVVPKKKRGFFAKLFRFIKFFGITLGVLSLALVTYVLINPTPSTTTTNIDTADVIEVKTEQETQGQVKTETPQTEEQAEQEAQEQAEQEAQELAKQEAAKAEQEAQELAEAEAAKVKAEQDAEKARLKAEKEAEEKAEQDAWNAINTITRPNGELLNRTEIKFMCNDKVKESLKAPRTAKFVGPFNSDWTDAVKSDNKWIHEVKVDSENQFGALLRSTWRCVVDGDEDTIMVEQIQ